MLNYKQQATSNKQTLNNEQNIVNQKQKTSFFALIKKEVVKCLFITLVFIPNLYGLEYGVDKHYIEECSFDETISERVFIAIMEDALGIKDIHSSKEAINIMDQLFKVFERRREKDESTKTYLKGKNIAFYKGETYINGLIPIDYVYDNLRPENRKKYHTKQLYEVLGYNRNEAKKIEDIARINKNFPLLKKAIRYSSIQNFWNKIREKTIPNIDPVLKGYLKKYDQGQIHKCIKAAADYIKSLKRLGIYTKNLELNDDDLEYSYNESIKKVQNLFKEYLQKFGEYISYFSPKDSAKFLDQINQLSTTPFIVKDWIDVAEKYRRYTHTEYMIRYMHRDKATPLCIISLNDACQNCEKMLAETTPQESWKYNTFVVSAQEYFKSRKIERSDDSTNFSLLLLQLHPKYFPDNRTQSEVVENKPNNCPQSEVVKNKPIFRSKLIQDSEFSFEKPAQTPTFSFGQSNSGFGSKPAQNSGFTFKNSPQTASSSLGSTTATSTPNNTFSFGFENTAPTPSSGTPAENYEKDSRDEDMMDID